MEPEKKDNFRVEIEKIIISVLYEYQFPINLYTATYQEMRDRRKNAIDMYLKDPMFHARVQTVAIHIMDALERSL